MATNNARTLTIDGVVHPIEDTTARASIAQVQAYAEQLDAAIQGLVGSEDVTTAINTFNEVVDFLAGVTNDETLTGKLNELRTLINAKYSKPASGIPASDLADGVIPDVSGFATKTEVNAKANAADVYSKAEVDAMNAGLPIASTIDTFTHAGTDGATEHHYNFLLKRGVMHYLDNFMDAALDTAGMTIYLRLMMDTATTVVADRTSQYVGRFTVPTNAAFNLTWMSPIQMTPSAEAVLDGLVAGHVYEYNIFEGALFVADVTGV